MSLTHIQSPYPVPDGRFKIEITHRCFGNSRCEKKHYLPTSLRDLPLLPYEVICHIFLEGRRLDAAAPTIVSHVCRSWRQIALSQCGLWTNIELECRENMLDRASAWAKRAGNMPISLRIRYSEHTDPGGIIAWLQEKANQIKSATILHFSRNDENDVLTSFPPLIHMESFQIVGMEEIDLDLRWIAKILEESPHLSSIAWSGVGGLHFHESLAGIASRLTHLSIGANSYIDYAFPLWVDAILDVVTTCSGLTSLECHALGKEDDRELQTVSLPSLLSLTIGDGPETCLILKYLDAPKLRTLRLVRGNALNEKNEVVEMPEMEFNRKGYVDLLVDCVRCLHETCSPPLTKVVWDRTIIDIDVLHQCAPFLRGMEELRCHEIGNIPQSLLALGTERTLLPFPCLRNMVFTKCKLTVEWLNTVHTLIKTIGVVHSPPIEQLVVEDCPGASDIYFRQA